MEEDGSVTTLFRSCMAALDTAAALRNGLRTAMVGWNEMRSSLDEYVSMPPEDISRMIEAEFGPQLAPHIEELLTKIISNGALLELEEIVSARISADLLVMQSLQVELHGLLDKHG